MTDLKHLSKQELSEQLASSLAQLEDSEGKSELQRLAQDLQTHQIELEMQNLELRETQSILEESRNRYADLYDFAPVGYLRLDSKGCITDINLTGARMLGKERVHLLDRQLTMWMEPSCRLNFLKHLELVFKEHQRANVEVKLKARENVPDCEVLLESSPDRAPDDTMQCRTVMVDIADRKRVERLLVEKSVAEKASEAKTQLLSLMSHEFRTPLNAVLGFAQLLELSSEKSLDPVQKSYIQKILSSGWYLLELVDYLLDMGALQGNKLETHSRPVDLVECVQACVDMTQALAEKLEISLHNQIVSSHGRTLYTDPFRLKQVLLNLLSNAVKYNQPGGRVTLESRLTDNEMLRITVTDTGVGIPQETMAHLFEPFIHFQRGRFQTSGTGIGLSIPKELIEHMQGQIGVTSEVGQGSAFWIELPMSNTVSSPDGSD